MIKLSLNELKLIAQNRNISGYENKSKEDLIKAFSEPKPETKLKQTRKQTLKPETKPKQTPKQTLKPETKPKQTPKTKLKPEPKIEIKVNRKKLKKT